MKVERLQWFVLSLFMVLALVVMTACGGQADEAADSSSSSSSESEEDDKGKEDEESDEDEDQDEDEDEDQDEDEPSDEESDEDQDEDEPSDEDEDEESDEDQDEDEDEPAFDGDLEGSYLVSGINPDDSAYEGTLVIEETGDTYQLVWEVGDTYVGTGIVLDNWFTTVTGEEGTCGVTAYQVQSDGSLDGIWAIQGAEDLGTEEATPADDEAEEDVAGSYDVVGTNPDGSEYEGTLVIEETGDTYQLVWEVGNDFVGTGILQDEVLGVVYGDEDICALNVYEIAADGTLEGAWTVQGAEEIAEEEAIPGEIAEEDESDDEDTDAGADTADVAIDSILLARDDGSGEPGEEVSAFTTNDYRLHFIINLDQVVEGIEATFVIRYVDEDIEIGELDFEWDEPLDYITAYFEPTGVDAWPAGAYELDIYLNDEFYRTVEYEVEAVGDDTTDQPEQSPEQSENSTETGDIDYETITDDTITLQIEVPINWTDRMSDRWVLSEEDVGVAMRVSPDISAYVQNWETPGVFFGASRVLAQEQGIDPQTFMDALTLEDCTFVSVEEYQDNLYTGLHGIWNECGGTSTEIHEFLFMPEDGSFLGQVEVQVVSEADQEALQHIVNSFQVIGDIE